MPLNKTATITLTTTASCALVLVKDVDAMYVKPEQTKAVKKE
jgi:hypothetical protein